MLCCKEDPEKENKPTMRFAVEILAVVTYDVYNTAYNGVGLLNTRKSAIKKITK